jgi:hypothetical protein
MTTVTEADAPEKMTRFEAQAWADGYNKAVRFQALRNDVPIGAWTRKGIFAREIPKLDVTRHISDL